MKLWLQKFEHSRIPPLRPHIITKNNLTKLLRRHLGNYRVETCLELFELSQCRVELGLGGVGQWQIALVACERVRFDIPFLHFLLALERFPGVQRFVSEKHTSLH